MRGEGSRGRPTAPMVSDKQATGGSFPCWWRGSSGPHLQAWGAPVDVGVGGVPSFSLWGGTAQPAATPAGAEPPAAPRTASPDHSSAGQRLCSGPGEVHGARSVAGALPVGGSLGGVTDTGQASTGAGVAAGDRVSAGAGRAAVAVCSGQSRRPPPTPGRGHWQQVGPLGGVRARWGSWGRAPSRAR